MAERNTGEVEGLNSDCACALSYATTLYNESPNQVDNYMGNIKLLSLLK